MAFTTFVPASIAELIAEVSTFCAGMGWAASYDSGAETATIIPKVGDAEFVLAHSSADQGTLLCTATKGANTVTGRSNLINGLAGAWVFGDNTPEPWCHIVINLRPHQYQHLYFGFIERYGDWECGAIVSGVRHGAVGVRDWQDSVASPLFSGGNSLWYNENPGSWIIMEGAHVPKPIGMFSSNTNTSAFLSGQYAKMQGGFFDPFNRGLIHPGMPLHNAIAPIAPILITADFAIDGWRVPMGTPPGIRMVNIDDIDPEQIITVGANDWQVFPLSDKTRDSDYRNWPEYPDGNYQQLVGASGYAGVALLRA